MSNNIIQEYDFILLKQREEQLLKANNEGNLDMFDHTIEIMIDLFDDPEVTKGILDYKIKRDNQITNEKEVIALNGIKKAIELKTHDEVMQQILTVESQKEVKENDVLKKYMNNVRGFIIQSIRNFKLDVNER